MQFHYMLLLRDTSNINYFKSKNKRSEGLVLHWKIKSMLVN